MTWFLIPAFIWLAWFSFRYAWWKPTVSYKYPRILMYHMISEPKSGAKFNGLRVSPKLFERQVKWFSDNGWNFVTMSELMAYGSDVPEKTVALTFDDGFEDNLLNAHPIMEKYGAKGTLYLVIDRHERDWSTQKKAHHNSGELVKEAKLSDEQVRSMVDSGLWEIGGHTETHANLAVISEDQRQEEILGAKQKLEALFSIKVDSFAYPFGIYTPEDPEHVCIAGHTNAVTTVEGINRSLMTNRFELDRIKISGKDNFFAFICRVRTGKRGLKK